MVLERAGDDLGGRGAAGVDQHDDRKAVRGVARPGIIAFDVALLAAALGDDLAMLQEGVGTADRLVAQAAGVGAKVEDVAQGIADERLLEAGEAGTGGVEIWSEAWR